MLGTQALSPLDLVACVEEPSGANQVFCKSQPRLAESQIVRGKRIRYIAETVFSYSFLLLNLVTSSIYKSFNLQVKNSLDGQQHELEHRLSAKTTRYTLGRPWTVLCEILEESPMQKAAASG